ncbi:MAG: MauE/DoxX family redox-associated membrane protein [Rikenellaceae bacterium]
MKKLQPYIALAATLAVGVAFVASALLKVQSIDSFELYIFSFEIFSLNLSALLARVVIGAELAVGVGYLCNICHKQLYYIILTALAGFTLFLLYLVVVGRTDNCHCFGSLVDISPAESILKNVALVALLLLSRKLPQWKFPPIKDLNTYFVLGLVAIALYPFMKHPHRAMFDLLYGKGGSGAVDVELFEEFIAANDHLAWGEQTEVLLFYGTSCKYCGYSAQQISQIVRRNNLPTDRIKVVFMGAKQEQIEEFFAKNNSVEFDYIVMYPKPMLELINGHLPTLIFYDATAKHGFTTRNMRSISEHELAGLL